MPRHALYEAFLRASALLTGAPRVELLATGLAQEHLAFLLRAAGEDPVAALLARFEEGASPELLLREPSHGPLARALVKLWYTGAWAPPEEHAKVPRGVVSAEAYKQGLVWPLLGTHPLGAREPGFGTWAEKPSEEP